MEDFNKLVPKMIGVLMFVIAIVASFFVAQTNESYKKYFLGALSSVSVTVGNVLPVASGTSLNGGSTITLTEDTTTPITVTGTVSDNNSCQDLASVTVAVYKEGTTCAVSGDANNNNCYIFTDSSPSTDSSCAGASDTTYTISHAFDMQYYTTGGTWKATILPSDVVGAGTSDISSGVTLNDLQSLDVGSIAYGSVAPGASSVGDHIASVKNTGNTAIAFKVSGTNLNCTTIGSIPVSSQQYSLGSFSYGTGTVLSGTPTDVSGNISAPTAGTVPVAVASYWQISIPNGTKGTCSGTTTFTAEPAI